MRTFSALLPLPILVSPVITLCFVYFKLYFKNPSGHRTCCEFTHQTTHSRHTFTSSRKITPDWCRARPILESCPHLHWTTTVSVLILLVTSVKYFKFLSFGNKKNSHSSSADVRDRGFPTITITVTGAAWVFQATFTLQVVLRQLFYIIVKIWVQCKQSSTLKWPIHTAQGVTSRTVVTELNIDATRQILHACVSIWKSFFKHRQSLWSLYQPAADAVTDRSSAFVPPSGEETQWCQLSCHHLTIRILFFPLTAASKGGNTLWTTNISDLESSENQLRVTLVCSVKAVSQWSTPAPPQTDTHSTVEQTREAEGSWIRLTDEDRGHV